MYMPAIKGGRTRSAWRFGGYRSIVLSDLRSPGPVEYLYVMPVYKVPGDDLRLCVAAERNALAATNMPGDGNLQAGGSHFLCLFPGEGHVNYGASDDWADLERFTRKALEIARRHLEIDDEAVEVPLRKPWWKIW